ARVFTKEPKIVEDLDQYYRYNAACSALCASADRGAQGGSISNVEQTRLRVQALHWLWEDLQARAARLEHDPTWAIQLQTDIDLWKNDADLIAIRDEKEIAKLNADERNMVKRLWVGVDTLEKKAKQRYSRTNLTGFLNRSNRDRIHRIKFSR